MVFAAWTARFEISRATARLSTPWIISNNSTASRTLFVCKCPINCQRARPGLSGIFAFASWTLFSPNSHWPAATASRIASGGCVLETAISMTEDSSRPARAQAAAMRCRINCKLSAKLTPRF